MIQIQNQNAWNGGTWFAVVVALCLPCTIFQCLKQTAVLCLSKHKSAPIHIQLIHHSLRLCAFCLYRFRFLLRSHWRFKHKQKWIFSCQTIALEYGRSGKEDFFNLLCCFFLFYLKYLFYVLQYSNKAIHLIEFSIIFFFLLVIDRLSFSPLKSDYLSDIWDASQTSRMYASTGKLWICCVKLL